MPACAGSALLALTDPGTAQQCDEVDSPAGGRARAEARSAIF